VGLLALPMASGCDSNNAKTGAGTGGYGAGAAANDPGASRPIGGATGTGADGTPTTELPK
jgi:hypothetical protein